MARRQLFTIGVYGTCESSFFDALVTHGITHFVDVRRRRGLRGSEYSYANSNALQKKLAELGIRYVHRMDLSPSNEIRSAQIARDAAAGTGQRARQHLSDEFVTRYQQECLAGFDARRFLSEFPDDARLVLFCVEHRAEACHRSLLATKIASETGQPWKDITPDP